MIRYTFLFTLENYCRVFCFVLIAWIKPIPTTHPQIKNLLKKKYLKRKKKLELFLKIRWIDQYKYFHTCFKIVMKNTVWFETLIQHISSDILVILHLLQASLKIRALCNVLSHKSLFFSRFVIKLVVSSHDTSFFFFLSL